jgi:hypothetical protein
MIEQDERLNKSSASSFAIDASCPGRQNLLRTLPPEPPKESKTEEEKTEDEKQAERGTRLHKAWETGNFADLDSDELDDYNTGILFKEKAIEQWKADFGVETFSEYREQRLWMHDPKTLQPILSGETDVYATYGPFAIIIDFKSGWNKTLTSSERNWQLRVYAALVKLEHPEVTRIRVGFVKPKDSFRAGPDFTDYTEEDLAHAERDIRFHLWKTTLPDAQRVPGTHCRWCRAKAFCPEAGTMALLPSMIIPTAMEPTKETIKMLVYSMSYENLAVIQSRASIIGKILEEVKDRLKSLTPEQLEPSENHGRHVRSTRPNFVSNTCATRLASKNRNCGRRYRSETLTSLTLCAGIRAGQKPRRKDL